MPKRRSARQSAASTAALEPEKVPNKKSNEPTPSKPRAGTKKTVGKKTPVADEPKKADVKDAVETAKATKQKPAAKAAAVNISKSTKPKEAAPANGRAASEDPAVDSIPKTNPEAPRHDGEWYWLLKAEPETRFENGIDVRFSIDDLRAKTKPEGWDGEFMSYHGVGDLSADHLQVSGHMPVCAADQIT